MNEIWKNLKYVKGYEKYSQYEISSYGRIRSLDVTYPNGKRKIGKIKKIRLNEKGYCVTTLSLNNKSKTVRIHRLVALAFIPNPENKPEVNHKDGNKENNHVDNLEWVTRKENMKHAYENRLFVHGENMHNSKLKPDDVMEIKKEYKRLGDNFDYKYFSNKYNVGLATIYDITSERTWKHVKV